MAKFEIRDLDLYYGAFQALKKINLDIAQNEITAFIGPSGCGKSTLLKTLNRMNDLVGGVKITDERFGGRLQDRRKRAAGRRGYLRSHGCLPAAQTRGDGISKTQSISHERL